MSLKNKKITFIGAGNMAEALIRGILRAKLVEPSRITAADVRAERLALLQSAFGIRTTGDNTAALRDADIVILAVKPQQLGAALESLRPISAPLWISIVAGVSISQIEKKLGGSARVVRVMPNTPALVGAGAAGLAKGARASEEDLVSAEAIFHAVGITARIDETLMDAVTALSGSGPAYIFLVTEAMINGGIALGLDPAMAKALAVQTVHGAAELLMETGEEPQSLRSKVTSPGGTTEAAVRVMSSQKLLEIFVDAMRAAAQRSQELSQQLARS